MDTGAAKAIELALVVGLVLAFVAHELRSVRKPCRRPEAGARDRRRDREA